MCLDLIDEIGRPSGKESHSEMQDGGGADFWRELGLPRTEAWLRSPVCGSPVGQVSLFRQVWLTAFVFIDCGSFPASIIFV